MVHVLTSPEWLLSCICFDVFSPKINKASSSTESLVDLAAKKTGGVRFHTDEGEVNTKNELVAVEDVEVDSDIMAKLDADLAEKSAALADNEGSNDTKKERRKKKSDGKKGMNLASAWFKHIFAGCDV